jgi:glycosyltransferase involved in cell wall biosynthesis
LVSYTSLLGGAELILLDHATALAGPVVLACPEGPLAEWARAAGIAVEPLAARRIEARTSVRDRLATPLRISAQARELRRIVAARQPRCVVAWGMRALLSCSAALRGSGPRLPLVFQHNDLLPSPLVGRAVHAAARRAELTIALSHAIADDLQRAKRLPAPVEVIRAGVDLDRFRPRVATTSPAAPTALMLSAITAWKRPDLALETVALAARELPGLRLRIAGAPVASDGARLLARLERRAAEADLAGRVEFAGRIDDVPAALAAATCLLHCSDREPYGMALVEALACGRPVVAPAAAGPLEIVDAGCGALYPPGDAPAAAVALADVVRRAESLGVAARVRAEARFDGATARARFAALVEGVVA